MSETKKNQKGQINIELDASVAEGTYSNLAIINHSVSEFVVDFVNIMPGIPKSKVKSRIILTPQHAKRLSKALHDNVKRFERKSVQKNFLPQSSSDFIFAIIIEEYGLIGGLWVPPLALTI